MTGPTRVSLVHPTGNANVRQAALAFAEGGNLHQFWTGVSWPSRSRADWLIPQRALAELRRRSFPPAIEPFIRTSPWREGVRLAVQKLWPELAEARASLSANASFESLSRRVAREVAHTPTPPAVVYAYDHCGLEVFHSARRRGIATVYDLTAPYWRYTQDVAAQEAERFPEWRNTVGSLDFPGSIYARKDAELAVAEKVIVASGFARTVLLRYQPTLAGRVFTVGYGAPPPLTEPRTPRTSGKLRVLYVGRLTLTKGIQYLAAAARQLRDVVDLTIVGSRSGDCAPLDQFLASTRWIPSVPHGSLLRLMREHDVLVFPTLFEGYGLVITEAMSQGCVVVTTDRTIGGDIIDGSNGILVAAGSSDAIVEAIMRLNANRDLLFSMGAEALKWCAANGWSRYRCKLRNIVLATSA